MKSLDHPGSPLHNANNDTERLRSLLCADYELTTENLINTNDYLEIPLCFGWTEQAVFYKEKLIKSELLYYDGVTWQSIPIEQNLSWFDKAGCLLSFFAWPILYVQSRLVKRRLNRNKRSVKITTSLISPMTKR